MIWTATKPLYVITAANRRQVSGKQGDETIHAGGQHRLLGGCLPRKHVYGENPAAPPLARHVQPIPREQWPARVKALLGNGLSDLLAANGIPASDQNGLNYCHAYSTTESIELQRLAQNEPRVPLSPESIGGPITAWRNVGASLDDDLAQASQCGACAATYMDRPLSRRPALWKQGWEANALLHKIELWYDVASWDETITLGIYRQPRVVGLDWWGHAILSLEPVLLDGSIPVVLSIDNQGGFGPLSYPATNEVVLVHRNSWGANWPYQSGDGYFALDEEMGTPSLGCFAPAAVTLSDQ